MLDCFSLRLLCWSTATPLYSLRSNTASGSPSVKASSQPQTVSGSFVTNPWPPGVCMQSLHSADPRGCAPLPPDGRGPPRPQGKLTHYEDSFPFCPVAWHSVSYLSSVLVFSILYLSGSSFLQLLCQFLFPTSLGDVIVSIFQGHVSSKYLLYTSTEKAPHLPPQWL